MKTLFLFLLLAAQGFAAISATTVWELSTTGNDLNGGGYSSGGTDYSQQDAAQLSVTDGSSSSTTTLNSVTGGFTSAMVGNVLQISGGTLTAGFYQIVTYTDTNNVVLDRALNTGSGSTVKVGGALLTPDKLDDGLVAGNDVYIKYHATNTYGRTTTWSFAVVGSNVLNIRFIGYDTDRVFSNTDANRPTFTTATNTIPIITGTGVTYTLFKNIRFTNTAETPGECFSSVTTTSVTSNIVTNCYFSGFLRLCQDSAVSGNNFAATFYWCEFTSFTSTVWSTSSSSSPFWYCYFHDNTSGVLATGSASPHLQAYYCIFDTNGGWAMNNTRATSSQGFITAIGCTFYNNTSGGIQSTGNAGIIGHFQIANCVFWGKNSADTGIKITNTGNEKGTFFVQNNAFGNFASGAESNFDVALETYIVLTAIPFTDAPNQDFTLNNDAGGGVLLRELAWPRTFPGSSTTEYRDVGATQHKKPTISN